MTAALAEDADKRRWLPSFGQRPPGDYGTSEAAGELLVRIAAGEADPLSGLLLGVGDDLSGLAEQVDQLRVKHRRALRVL